jgi:hypothetical protein
LLLPARCLGGLHGLVQLEFGCDPAGLTDLGCLAALSNLQRLALRGLSLEAGKGEWMFVCLHVETSDVVMNAGLMDSGCMSALINLQRLALRGLPLIPLISFILQLSLTSR